MADSRSTSDAQPTAGTIIHLGAGRGHALADYLAANPARIVLVEADPARARELERLAPGHEHVEVIAAAATDQDGTATLQRFNLKDLNSLATPTTVLELLPGLRQTDTVEVDTIALETLLAREDLEPGQGNLLVIDTPGSEPALINALCQSDALSQIDRIDLHCGHEPLFEDGEPARELLQRLSTAGHEIEDCDEESDPDRPCWRLALNPVRVENLQLRAQLEENAEQVEQLRAQFTSLEGTLKERTNERDEQAKLAEERQQEIKRLTGERDEAVTRADKAAEENRAQAEKIADLEKQTKELTSSRDEQAQEAEERKQTLETLQQDKDSLEQKIADLEKQTIELTQSRDQAHQAEQEASERLEAEIKRREEEADARAKAEELEQQRSRQLAERQQQLQRLQADESEIQARDGQLEEEITRAEAQIDLIKDLFLHEDRQ